MVNFFKTYEFRKVQRLDEIAELKKKLEFELKEAERLRLVIYQYSNLGFVLVEFALIG